MANQLSRLMRETNIARRISAPMAKPVPPVSQQLTAASKNATSIIPMRKSEGRLMDKGLRNAARLCMALGGPIALRSSLFKVESVTSDRLARSAAGGLSGSALADSPKSG